VSLIGFFVTSNANSDPLVIMVQVINTVITNFKFDLIVLPLVFTFVFYNIVHCLKIESSLSLIIVPTFFFSVPEQKTKLGLTHKVLDVIYKLGDVKDPLTNKPVVIDRYRDQVCFEQTEIFLINGL